MPAIETSPTVRKPINLKRWVEENRHLLKPPVSNQYLYSGKDFFVMVIVGPNARNDFHLTESEEYFYQLQGDVRVRTREDGKTCEYVIREGETFFIPGGVPHCPVRPPGTVGVVVERVRPPGEMEHLLFYCEKCNELVEDIEFDCRDIVEHFRDTMEAFWADDRRRTCKHCGQRVERPQPVRA